MLPACGTFPIPWGFNPKCSIMRQSNFYVIGNNTKIGNELISDDG
jgi:hypothetical protein